LWDFEIKIDDIPASERVSTPMHRAFYENTGTVVHKWRGYLQIYDRHFSRFRNSRVRILEIGVSRGGSLQMWRDYFGGEAVIFGIDVDRKCAQYDGVAGQVRIGSQDDPAFLESVVSEMGGVDIIIDDGSHIGRHQRVSFEVLFPLLDNNGIYLREDTHAAYWPGQYEGGYRRKTTFIEFAKRIIDDIHAEFHRHKTTFKHANRIGGIHFYNSIIVFEKAPQNPSSHLKVP
jgi:hypothetical protein